MEKALLEKLFNGNCDEIDVEMIASRELRAVKELIKVMNTVEQQIKGLVENYSDELKLLDTGIVFGATCLLDDDKDGIGVETIWGRNKSVKKIITCVAYII